jgi:hypothetical protein
MPFGSSSVLVSQDVLAMCDSHTTARRRAPWRVTVEPGDVRSQGRSTARFRACTVSRRHAPNVEATPITNGT